MISKCRYALRNVYMYRYIETMKVRLSEHSGYIHVIKDSMYVCMYVCSVYVQLYVCKYACVY